MNVNGERATYNWLGQRPWDNDIQKERCEYSYIHINQQRVMKNPESWLGSVQTMFCFDFLFLYFSSHDLIGEFTTNMRQFAEGRNTFEVDSLLFAILWCFSWRLSYHCIRTQRYVLHITDNDWLRNCCQTIFHVDLDFASHFSLW